MQTITDKKGFSCNVVEKSRFNNLSQEQKEYFELFRNAILEIFPVGPKDTYDDNTISFAERFAFVGIRITDKIQKSLEQKIQELQTTLASTQQNNGAATGAKQK